jgi:hypothetical protein
MGQIGQKGTSGKLVVRPLMIVLILKQSKIKESTDDQFETSF